MQTNSYMSVLPRSLTELNLLGEAPAEGFPGWWQFLCAASLSLPINCPHPFFVSPELIPLQVTTGSLNHHLLANLPPNFTSLDLGMSQFNDDDAKPFERFSNLSVTLEKLSVRTNTVGDFGWISRLSSLQSLSLRSFEYWDKKGEEDYQE